MKKRSIDIKGIITQFLLIVFSVVFGLYLSERIEERKNRQDSEVLLSKIKAEVKDNIELLEYWVPYHQEMHENLDSLSKEAVFIEEFIKDKYVFFQKIVTRRTFMGRSPANDAWDIAKSHPLIVNVDYDKLLILSRIYNQQESTFEPLLELFEIFNSKDVNIEKDAKLNLELILDRLHDFVARENQLMYYYKESVEILDLYNNDK